MSLREPFLLCKWGHGERSGGEGDTPAMKSCRGKEWHCPAWSILGAPGSQEDWYPQFLLFSNELAWSSLTKQCLIWDLGGIPSAFPAPSTPSLKDICALGVWIRPLSKGWGFAPYHLPSRNNLHRLIASSPFGIRFHLEDFAGTFYTWWKAICA